MKVLQILYSGLGGHGNVAFSLVDGDQSSSWRNTFIFFGAEPLLPEYQDRCEKSDIGCEYVSVKPGRPWASWYSLWRGLRRYNPDVILCHSVKTILICWLYKLVFNRKLIAVEHQANHLKARAEWLVSYLLMFLADSIVYLTPRYEEEIKDRLGALFFSKKTSSIPNGIDLKMYSPITVRAKSAESVVIGMAARFTEGKRHDLLIDALCVLNNTLNCQLTLAGDGETLNRLKTAAVEKGVVDSVNFTGLLDQNELREWFHTLDIYVHASEGETLSTSLLQAMALGLPIIGSDVKGINNLLVTDGREVGLLCDNTAEAFASSFLRLLNDANLMKTLSSQASNVAHQEYGNRRMFELYNSVVKNV